MSRICRSLFENTTFKVGPSSPAQSPLVVPHAYDAAIAHYIFIESRTLHTFIGWGYTPLEGWYPETSRTQQNNKIQAEGKVSADTDTTTRFCWVISDDWEGLFLFESIHCFFFRKILLIIPLNILLITAENVVAVATLLNLLLAFPLGIQSKIGFLIDQLNTWEILWWN